MPLTIPVAWSRLRPAGRSGVMLKDRSAPPTFEGRLGVLAMPLV